jgi:hypothetical protein
MGSAGSTRTARNLSTFWQLSAYWHALYDAGFPIVEQFSILYWPKDRGQRADVPVEPIVADCAPVSRELVRGVNGGAVGYDQRSIGLQRSSGSSRPSDASARAHQQGLIR